MARDFETKRDWTFAWAERPAAPAPGGEPEGPLPSTPAPRLVAAGDPLVASLEYIEQVLRHRVFNRERLREATSLLEEGTGIRSRAFVVFGRGPRPRTESLHFGALAEGYEKWRREGRDLPAPGSPGVHRAGREGPAARRLGTEARRGHLRALDRDPDHGGRSRQKRRHRGRLGARSEPAQGGPRPLEGRRRRIWQGTVSLCATMGRVGAT